MDIKMGFCATLQIAQQMAALGDHAAIASQYRSLQAEMTKLQRDQVSLLHMLFHSELHHGAMSVPVHLT